MPMDITGTDILQDGVNGRREFQFVHGPVFANIILADEINRAPPKTQAAMLEAMQERRVTAIGKPFTLDPPFLVLATQNPVEQEGTYPLPEAQLDRFMFLIELDYPSEDEEIEIARTTTGDDLPELAICSTRENHRLPETRPPRAGARTYLQVRRANRSQDAAPWRTAPIGSSRWYWGAGPRAVQNLILGAGPVPRCRAATWCGWKTFNTSLQRC